MTPALSGKGWLELPGNPGNEEYVQATYMDSSIDGESHADKTKRNYTYNYDRDMFTSLWVAYPLYSAAFSGSNSAKWKRDPNVPDQYEINIVDSSYGVNVGMEDNTGYDSSQDYYARGHQIPNADRQTSASKNSQTYYVTNSTPQIDKGFNGGIWKSLEENIRTVAEATDTVYVVTGAAFQKKGESQKSVTWILPKNETVKKCPLPNYYWKVLLKVKRDSNGKIISASSVGFWFEHKTYSNDSYTNHAVSVDQIEQWTGFDFFVNVPDSCEGTAEANNSWPVFQSF